MKDNKVIILTSCGLSSDKLKEEFKKLFIKDVEHLKMLYIPLAADVGEGDMSWIQQEFQHILDLGINKDNITEYRFEYNLDFKQFDFIYVLGGNSFYLLKTIKETNYDTKIIEAIDSGVVYVGSSAGSMILGTSVESDLLFDEDNIYLADFTGLKLFNGTILPHYQRMDNERTKQFIDKHQHKVYTINDGNGILIINDSIKEI